ncbi:hypothetical protein HQ865_22335 [Mucilaginibacter mali]|uniref:Uncharacterized protein n=1 Tax=Mucilaginibacter mali TaxID=2740462 RepID=A0A7D4UNW5_9SPHI|nr:hypothetical protein [Mucilaginibacter mali]QKJ32381.1 hypothetical protein HQ865_22335 [Mucilaginibacter mali]
MTNELPTYMQGNKLIFSTEQNTCICKIDFSKGPPAQLYNECAGDTYKFDKNNNPIN